MNKRPIVLCLLGASLLAGAGKKTLPSGRGESESVEVTGVLYTAKEDIQALLGSDLGGHYTVIQVRVASRFGREIEVRRDDFLLRTDKDGEKSTPFAASQIAGRGALVVSQRSTGSGIGVEAWAGLFGAGGGGGSTGESEARLDPNAGRKDAPIEKVLEEKILPEGKTREAASGLLYFPLARQKPKDLELIYTSADGKIRLRFR